VLKDAGVAEVYATEFKRTQQTAAPIAKALGLTVKIVPSKNTPDLLNAVKSAKGRVLVVGHSNTLPEVIKGLGIATPVTVDDGEFDNLFVVNADGKPSLVRLRYR
jgi:broad specificity phosphatase PhoE